MKALKLILAFIVTTTVVLLFMYISSSPRNVDENIDSVAQSSNNKEAHEGQASKEKEVKKQPLSSLKKQITATDDNVEATFTDSEFKIYYKALTELGNVNLKFIQISEINEWLENNRELDVYNDCKLSSKIRHYLKLGHAVINKDLSMLQNLEKYCSFAQRKAIQALSRAYYSSDGMKHIYTEEGRVVANHEFERMIILKFDDFNKIGRIVYEQGLAK